jgi:hypothetical protein
VKKGVIMEVDERFLTLLTPEGEFLRARNQKQDYLIGEEIDFFPLSENKKKKSLFFNLTPGKALPAAACAVIIAAASLIPFNNSDDVYAYMSIDVNPSIELAVNNELEVIDLEAYNVEGKNILSEIKDWEHQEVSVVTTNIIEEIREQGFFENHDKVVISTVYDDKKALKVKQQLEANIAEIEEKIEKENLQLTVVKATKQERKAAHKEGISTGVYKEKHQRAEEKVKEELEGKKDSLKGEEKEEKNEGKTPNQSKGNVKTEEKKAKDAKKIENIEKKKENQKNQKPKQSKNDDKDVKKKENKRNNSKNEVEVKKTGDDDPKDNDNHKVRNEKKNKDQNKDKNKNKDRYKDKEKNKDKDKDKNKNNDKKNKQKDHQEKKDND